MLKYHYWRGRSTRGSGGRAALNSQKKTKSRSSKRMQGGLHVFIVEKEGKNRCKGPLGYNRARLFGFFGLKWAKMAFWGLKWAKNGVLGPKMG